MNPLPRPLGSFTNWAILRLSELLALLFGFLFLNAQRDRLGMYLQATALGLLFLLLVYFHPFAFGFADDKGITFCRYIKLHFVPWSEVTRVQRRQWNAFELVIRLGRPITLTKTVKFPIHLARQEVDATFRGDWTPDVVAWLFDHLPPASVPTAKDPSTPPGRRDV